MPLGLQITSLGVRLTSLDETGSTNEDALRAARAGDPGPHWFLARRQRAGRGRGGRTWVSEPGNLHATLLVSGIRLNVAPQLGFVAGLALHDAVCDLAELGPRLRIKWPNDLLLDSAKLAGILLEAEGQENGAAAVAIGFGVNVAAAPENLPYPAISLSAVCAADVSALFAALAQSFAARFGAWRRAHERGDPDAFAETRHRWLERAAGLGQAITVRLPQGQSRGRFAGLDGTGRLLLDTDTGRHLIDAGDVLLKSAPTSGAHAMMANQSW